MMKTVLTAANGGCSEKWPPLMAGDGMTGKKEYSVITRAGGTKDRIPCRNSRLA
jgi:predicted lipoprotein with Yx(FWY)xxD motif